MLEQAKLMLTGAIKRKNMNQQLTLISTDRTYKNKINIKLIKITFQKTMQKGMILCKTLIYALKSKGINTLISKNHNNVNFFSLPLDWSEMDYSNPNKTYCSSNSPKERVEVACQNMSGKSVIFPTSFKETVLPETFSMRFYLYSPITTVKTQIL